MSTNIRKERASLLAVGHVVNKNGVPDACPKCGTDPIRVTVVAYDPMWYDGRVVCADCGHFIRDYDAG